jgi:diguanylate cyclase (GGDEF)-like protein
MTTAIFGASLSLAALALALFLLAARRVLARQEEVVTFMLQRYDDRLAEFAQTLNDALRAQPTPLHTSPAAESAVAGATPHGTLTRTLELARDTTESHAAVAVVAGSAEPTLATVGLSQSEVDQVGRLGFPDYRGARAIQVSFNGDAEAPPGSTPIRSGLAVPLLDSPSRPGMLAVLTRSPERRFGETDITALEGVVHGARPALGSELELVEPDPVPELDPLTELYDRRAFHALLDREIARARAAGDTLALLMLDVDRLTTLNAKVGFLEADAVLARLAALIREVAGRTDLPCRIGGGRFAVLLPRGRADDGQRLFSRVQSSLRDDPLSETTRITVSGGMAELQPADDAAALLGRADAALGSAKAAGRGSVVVSETR